MFNAKMNQQLLYEAEFDVKNYADLGECDLHNSSCHTIAESSSCLSIHSE